MDRIQRRRTKGWRMPENTVYVGRGSKYGNPFPVPQYDLDESLFLYRRYLEKGIKNGTIDLKPLIGKDLCCWCRLNSPCHADIILEKFEEV